MKVRDTRLPTKNRTERLIRLVRRLLVDPGAHHTLQELGGEAAKSTVSEDVATVERVFEEEGHGRVERVYGPAGGVRYLPFPSPERRETVLDDLAVELSRPDRHLQGGFLYLTDVVFSPRWAVRIGEIFASLFHEGRPNIVLTVETKGIPIALMTARALGIPLAVARREAGVTEGPALGLNYLSGTARRIGTMSLARRAIPEGSRVLIIDDFLKGGGTARGLLDMVREFDAEATGVGVLIETREPTEKLVSDYTSLLLLAQVPEGFRIERTTHAHGGGRP